MLGPVVEVPHGSQSLPRHDRCVVATFGSMAIEALRQRIAGVLR
jgi:hypothetical protein